MRVRVVFVLCVLAALVLFAARYVWPPKSAISPTSSSLVPGASVMASPPSPATEVTNVFAHNLMLRKGPGFRVYVRWLRGEIIPANRNVNPSFDEPGSFSREEKDGVIHTNVGDLTNLLNDELTSLPLKNIALSGDGNQIKLHGTLHEIVPLPIELLGTIAAAPGNRIQLHVTQLSLLKIPFGALLGDFHLTVSSLFHPKPGSGIEVSGNDVFFDTEKLLPAPHIRGQLKGVRVVNPDFEEVYGNAQEDVARVAQWRNFLQLTGGTIDFGKLTMHHVDLIMVDLSNDAWFDLDLAHYQEQLVNGYTRMTPQAGLQIFMPDVEQIPKTKQNQDISMEWMKNRNLPPPPDISR